MAIGGIFDNGFKFRSLTAVHPELIKRMENKSYYAKMTVSKDRKNERKNLRRVQAIKG